MRDVAATLGIAHRNPGLAALARVDLQGLLLSLPVLAPLILTAADHAGACAVSARLGDETALAARDGADSTRRGGVAPTTRDEVDRAIRAEAIRRFKTRDAAALATCLRLESGKPPVAGAALAIDWLVGSKARRDLAETLTAALPTQSRERLAERPRPGRVRDAVRRLRRRGAGSDGGGKR